jgi:hypothetical protein
MLLKPGCELRAVGFLDRDEVLDRQGVEHLAAETLADDAGANALARGVDGCRGAGGAAADDEHVEGLARRDLVRLTLQGAGIDLADDLLERHAALPELFAVEKDRGHPHDLALGHFVLEQRTIDHLVADAGVEHRHQVQRLNDIGTVVAGQRDEGLEMELARYGANLVDHAGLRLRGMAAGLQQGKDQRGEFVPHRDAGKADACRFARAADGKRRLAGRIAILPDADLAGKLGDVLHQSEHLLRLAAGIERGDQFDRVLDFFEVGPQLCLDVGVQHVSSPLSSCIEKGPPSSQLCGPFALRPGMSLQARCPAAR